MTDPKDEKVAGIAARLVMDELMPELNKLFGKEVEQSIQRIAKKVEQSTQRIAEQLDRIEREQMERIDGIAEVTVETRNVVNEHNHQIERLILLTDHYSGLEARIAALEAGEKSPPGQRAN